MSKPHKLIAAFNLQAYYCRDLGSPFMGDCCDMFAKHLTPDTEVGNVLFDWQGDVTAGGASLPLRLMGCLHRLVLSGECPELVAIYPPHDEQTSASEKWPVFEQALSDHKQAILAQLEHAPQTNEVRRAGVLLPGFLTIAVQTGNLPMVMSELGASAGLNINWDQFYYEMKRAEWGNQDSGIKLDPEWKGKTPPLHDLKVVERAGCDLNPIDLSNPDTVQTLLSYLWADQPERIERTRAAIEIFNRYPANIEKAGAIDWLNQRLAIPYENQVHVIYHTIAWQYFSDADKAEGKALIEAAGAQATTTSPLAWLRFEADGQLPGAALTLRLWPGGDVQHLARADYHGRWVDWKI